MSGHVELVILQGDRAQHAFKLGRKPVSIGRGPDNDLVISDGRISWNHALVWVEEGKIWLKDLGSLNGTFLNGERIREPVAAKGGDRLRLGAGMELLIRGEAPRALTGFPRALVLEDLESDVQIPLRSDRLYIGSASDADLRIEGAPERAATLIIHPDGEVWLGREDETEHPIDLGQVFEICGHRFQIVEADPVRQPTVEQEPDRYPYRLTVTLDGATGPEAALEDLSAPGRIHRIDSDNRAVLMYLLVRQYQKDAEAGLPPIERGWCADNDVVTGIWGRSAKAEDPNRLHVLVHRVRRELKSAGFEPWCIEKRRRYIRLRVAQVVSAN